MRVCSRGVKTGEEPVEEEGDRLFVAVTDVVIFSDPAEEVDVTGFGLFIMEEIEGEFEALLVGLFARELLDSTRFAIDVAEGKALNAVGPSEGEEVMDLRRVWCEAEVEIEGSVNVPVVGLDLPDKLCACFGFGSLARLPWRGVSEECLETMEEIGESRFC